MRILLIMAPTGERQHSVHAGANYPLALAQLAGQLDRKHEVRGYNPDVMRDYPDSLTGLLKEFTPDLIGISFRIFDSTLSYEPRSYLFKLESALALIRRYAPTAIVALGGSAYSIFPELLLQRLPQVDFGFYLDADTSFPAFVENPSQAREIKGIYYRQNGNIAYTGPLFNPPLDDLSMPDFDLFPFAPYLKEGVAAIGLESKRGCNLQCVPCIYPFITGKTVHTKSPERVVSEAQELVRRGAKSFFFLDSIFNIPHPHGIAISEALRKAKLPIAWGAFFSAGRFDDAACSLFYDAGCRLFYFAPDGISERAIKTWGRPITKQKQMHAIDLVRKKKDSRLHVSFLIGSPGEGLADFLEFGAMLLFLAVRRAFSISMSYTRIYPHTKIWEIAVNEGILSKENDLLEPTFYRRFPASLARFIFHPIYRATHAIVRIKKQVAMLYEKMFQRCG